MDFNVTRDQLHPRWLTPPRCKVHLVCGAPGSGKSTHVATHRQPGDTVIDVDEILAELAGLPLYVGDKAQWLGAAIDERNRRLQALAAQPADHVAWFIVGAADPAACQWWAVKLRTRSIVVIHTPRRECLARIAADPRRAHCQAEHIAAVNYWFDARERAWSAAQQRAERDSRRSDW
ncbi:ATP-binding protein [Aquincola tertiaricarbonis]|uniref:ATP-binding protein n=1 Tax=Aquincola tertiaricarbonis TaxID=391953 RepID=A0ABY4SH29_AQUTE|nr:AAA family ATPase [Aquincola tertiaricarbonis]URI11432.1 ATP-binding protein [Aquincola tertiaricarbonis]